jgi:hypothetical protein
MICAVLHACGVWIANQSDKNSEFIQASSSEDSTSQHNTALVENGEEKPTKLKVTGTFVILRVSSAAKRPLYWQNEPPERLKTANSPASVVEHGFETAPLLSHDHFGELLGLSDVHEMREASSLVHFVAKVHFLQ